MSEMQMTLVLMLLCEVLPFGSILIMELIDLARTRRHKNEERTR